jgi:hypothetical protein
VRNRNVRGLLPSRESEKNRKDEELPRNEDYKNRE